MKDELVARQQAIRLSVDIFISLGVIVLIAYLALSVIAPFLSVVIWALIMAIGVYPYFVMLRRRMGPAGGWASTLIALIGLVVLIIPTVLVVQGILESLGPFARSLADGSIHVPPPNEAIKDWPLIGEPIYATWAQASDNLGAVAAQYAGQIRETASRMLAISAGLLGGVFQFALSIVFAAVFMSYADPLVKITDQLAERIASNRGSAMLMMAAQTARNVTKGVIGVAVIQGGLGALGIMALGMPFAGVVAALMVASTLVQAPVLVIVPTIIYAWAAEPTFAALIFTVYMIPVLLSDNVLKPVLMARGLETPMVVILIGVIGGTLSGGLIGLFTGPVILAVFHKMLLMWLQSVSATVAQAPLGEGDAPAEAAAEPAATPAPKA